MNRIEIEIYERTSEDPRLSKYVGQRTAQEVFAELKHQLDCMGFLPDEYFELDDYWKDCKEIPKDSVMFSTTDFGGSEGIYIDVYLKWHDEEQNKSVTKNFITGKTLGDTEVDLDRMNLIASAITKCFSTGTHPRYISLGEPEQTEGCVLHLNGAERRVMIDSLICRHHQLTEETLAVEKLLRRITGSISEYINETGKRPMIMSDFDNAVLAIKDGCLALFEDVYLRTPDKLGDLLIHAAARPGNVGKTMISMLLSAAKDIPNETYLAACKQAIKTGDAGKTIILVKMADESRAEDDLTIYGDLIMNAMYEHKQKIAQEIMKLCTPEMLAASDPRILPQALHRQDFDMAIKCVESGIDTNRVALDTIHALVYRGNSRSFFKVLLDHGMEIANNNYSAMRACINTESPELGKILIDRGMDFDCYLQWSAEACHGNNTGVTFDEIKAYWDNREK